MDAERLAPLVLVVDDDAHVRRLVEVLFERAGFDVITAANGAQAMAALRHGVPDLAIVDRGMPVMDGFELARALKGRADVPIIILTASGDKDTIVQAINAFAEDYVVKPFDGRELIARAKRILRRFGEVPVQRGRQLVLSPEVQISFSDRTVTVQGRTSRTSTLTATEARLVSVLARNANRVVPSSALLQRVWDPAEAIDVDTLRVHIRRVREKVEPEPNRPQYLMTDRGVGYRLVVQTAADAPPPVQEQATKTEGGG
jgi:DNA-binding response OmpR family regulator